MTEVTTGVVAGVVPAEAPWVDQRRACPLLDLRTAARRGYNSDGKALMNAATLRHLRENVNPADLWGRRSTAPAWERATLAQLFENDDLPVPYLDRNISDGFVVLCQEGLPVLTIDVGG
jgi:hypothetical protein